MRLQWLALALILFALPLQGVEPQHFRLGETQWVYAGDTPSEEASYIPAGEDPNNWKELVTFYQIPSGELSLPEYYQTFMALLNSRSEQPIQSTPIHSDKDSFLFSWKMEGEDPQQGLIKISKIPSGLSFFRYTVRDPAKSQEKLLQWEKLLEEHTLEITPNNVSVSFPKEFDGSKWKMSQSNSETYHYVPKGSTLKNAKERVTIHIWSELPMPLNDYYRLLAADLKSQAQGNFESELINMSDTSLFFKWKSEGGPSPQYGWYLVKIIGPDVAAVARYTADKEGDADLWEPLLQAIDFNVDYTYEVVPDSSSSPAGVEQHHQTAQDHR